MASSARPLTGALVSSVEAVIAQPVRGSTAQESSPTTMSMLAVVHRLPVSHASSVTGFVPGAQSKTTGPGSGMNGSTGIAQAGKVHVAARVPLAQVAGPQERVGVQVGDEGALVKRPRRGGGGTRIGPEHGVALPVEARQDGEAQHAEGQESERDEADQDGGESALDGAASSRPDGARALCPRCRSPTTK